MHQRHTGGSAALHDREGVAGSQSVSGHSEGVGHTELEARDVSEGAPLAFRLFSIQDPQEGR